MYSKKWKPIWKIKIKFINFYKQKDMKLSKLIFPIVFAIIITLGFTFIDDITKLMVHESEFKTERGYVKSVDLHTETSGTFLSINSETIPVAMIELPNITAELKDKQLLSKFKAGDSIYVRFKEQTSSVVHIKNKIVIEDVDLLKSNLKSESKLTESAKAERDELIQPYAMATSIVLGLGIIVTFLSLLFKMQ